jgi:hypothetical protein
MSQQYFLQTIRHLRESEEVMLYEQVLFWEKSEENEVVGFLFREYQNESLDYPYQPSEFNSNAALWAAKTIYLAAQLILYRDHKEDDLEMLFLDYEGDLDSSAILSADLCLRFLPDMLFQLKVIDTQDRLIDRLEKIAYKWHYSSIRYPLEIERLSFEFINSDNCLRQMYVNRIIEYKKLKLAEHSACHELVKASLGIHGKELWKEFTLVTNYE